ncbi:MAG: thiamine pyrophosphate-dependent dehydrogenase E1 component subunit alpha [Actinomycetia bacterium]|nr:thiamine pyrophosphate-dependent dehydrogenase E1 component subunit alpha [Actinomycetes bacterium]
MYTIRKFEEKVKELFSLGLIRGSTHVYIGEEAVAVGACSALASDDYIVSTHRGHGHCIAKGAELRPMMAELLGKETGCCKGKGGSMHIADFDKGILGAVGIVGAGLPIAVGAALSSKYLNNGKITISFFGDGASNQGTFHECLNLASIWKLPIIFVCENNCYAITVPASYSTSCTNIADRAPGYNIEGIITDGSDVEKVYIAVKKAVDNVKNGSRTVLIEAKTYRYEGHWIGDPQVYRSKEEIDYWKTKDPINNYKKKLINEKIITENSYTLMTDKVDKLIEDAVEFAKNSKFLSADKALDDIYTSNDFMFRS